MKTNKTNAPVMLTSEQIKALEEKKKALVAEIDAEIEKVKNLGKAHEDLSALVQKYKFENVTQFLQALGINVGFPQPRVGAKATAKSSAPAGEFKRGKFSQTERDQIKRLHDEDKLTPAQIAAKMKRSENAIVKILNDTK